MDDWSEFRPNLKVFDVPQKDPGWLYLVRTGDLFKIGKTRNPKRRLNQAATWAPDIEIVAVKPFWNISALERKLHEGLSEFWHKGEWFRLSDRWIQKFLIEGLQGFYERDRDMNSVDFIYWYNGSGMMEFRAERHQRGISLRQFQKQLSAERNDVTT